MAFLRNVWYAAVWSEALPPLTLVARQILKDRIVLFRREDGSPAALADICPHRLAPLHMGRLLPGDRLQCGYHGLEFSAAGNCVANPHGSQRAPAACKVRAYPVVEKHTMVWIWMGQKEPDTSLIPEFSFLDDRSSGYTPTREAIAMGSNYRFIVDNLLDLSHGPFLHPEVLGNPDTIHAKISVTKEGRYVFVHREMNNVRPPLLMDLVFKGDGCAINMPQTIRWSAPAALLNKTWAFSPGESRDQGVAFVSAHILTPETETTTIYHTAGAGRGRMHTRTKEDAAALAARVTELRRFAFKEQDDRMLNAQQRNAHENPGIKPVLLAIDAGPVRCNRILDEMIAAEQGSGALPAERVPEFDIERDRA
jgi:phenylpropionate dioxygenase-like ring-hydroxylating dioxygenase large terminal subunit